MNLVGDVQALTFAPFLTSFSPAMMFPLSLQLPVWYVLNKLLLSVYICYLIYLSHLKLPEHSCVQAQSHQVCISDRYLSTELSFHSTECSPLHSFHLCLNYSLFHFCSLLNFCSSFLFFLPPWSLLSSSYSLITLSFALGVPIRCETSSSRNWF